MFSSKVKFHGKIIILFGIVFSFIFFILFTTNTKELSATTFDKEVSVIYAGSLINIFENKIKPAFQNLTVYNFIGEAKGSVQISNMILDGFRKPDIFVSADTTPIERLINQSTPLADWFITFGSAELVIAFNPNSIFAPELLKASKDELPWYKVIGKEGFKFGRTDPELDPKGYYTIIAAKLANIYYNDSTIKEKVLGQDKNRKQIFPEEVLKSILDSGQIDASAAYKHEAIAKGLPYISLPDQINLSNPNYTNFYNKISYKLKTGETIIGNPIFFSITIPNTVENIQGAINFAKFFLSENGMKILEYYGLDPIKPILHGDIYKMNPGLLSFIQGYN
ncbi:MAG: extracellular solute-binding protein [Nitrososphaeraceae archaeon]